MERRRVDRMTGHVLAPVIEGHAPGIGAVVTAKARQSMIAGLKAKPAAVLLAHRAIGRFDLGMMKNRLAKNKVAVRSPGKIVQGMMRIFTTEACQRAAKMAADIHGGYGCMEEYAVTRYLRDSFVVGPSAGTSDIMKVIIGRWVLS
jgi:alkylation response protein AidB-like acyl-CoA dehydrogenase